MYLKELRVQWVCSARVNAYLYTTEIQSKVDLNVYAKQSLMAVLSIHFRIVINPYVTIHINGTSLV